MKILLFGKNGQVGWELQRALTSLGEVVALDRHSTDHCGDLGNLEGLRTTLRTLAPDVVVNAAAYTAVDKAESDQANALLINSQASQVMATEVAVLGGWLADYSTDYVFDGSGDTPWSEADACAPLNFYGYSKLQAERTIEASGCNHLIFRTSWVYAARGNNFVKTMLRLAKEREVLSVVADQIGAPTPAALLADVTAHAIRAARRDASVSGIYHLAPTGSVSWHGYAQFVIEQARVMGEQLRVGSINPIPAASYPTPAARPLNSRLNTEKLTQTFDVFMPDWRVGVVRMLDDMIRK